MVELTNSSCASMLTRGDFEYIGSPSILHTPSIDPMIDMKTPPVDQVNRMSAEVFFKTLALLMKKNPPAPADAPVLAKFAKIGLVPGQDFELSKLDPGVAE